MLKNFKTKEVNSIMTIGKCLKQKRCEAGFSIEEVSRKLKIKTSYIKDLEEDNYKNLPPDVYIKGFIKNYAELLNLDSKRIIGRYAVERSFEIKANNESRLKDLKNQEKEKSQFLRRFVITPKIAAIFISLLILFTVGYYLWYQISSFNSTPYLFISSPISDKVVNKPSIIIEGETEKDVVVKINGEDVFVDQNNHFKESIMLQPKMNKIIIEATNRFNKKRKEVRNIIYEMKSESIFPIKNAK